MDASTHELIADVYAAVTQEDGWQRVCDRLSQLFGDAIVTIGLLSDARDPRPSPGATQYATGMDVAMTDAALAYLLEETPWTNRSVLLTRDRFACMAEEFEHIDLTGLRFYEEWMKPQGMAAIWPYVHTFLTDEDEPLGGVTVFRREGQGPFTDAELERAQELIPHLSRAAQMHRSLHSVVQQQVSLGDAIDRLPTGVLLLDGERRVVLQNDAASRILAEEDGLRVDAHGPSAADARDNVRLQELIARALSDDAAPPDIPNVLRIRRPSGKREFTLTVSALLATDARPAPHHPVAVIFVVDPELERSAPAEVLEDLYDLTHSEAQIVRLIAEGLTIDEAATRRGVSVNTARSHLKHAFAKTGTTRQSELLRLVLAGVGSVGSD